MSMRSLLPDLLALVEAATRGAAQGGGSRQVVAAVSAAAIRTVLGLGDACGSSRAVDVDAEVFRSCRSLHDMLAHRLADDRAAHSLGQSIRAAQARGLLQPDMAQRVRRVAQASNALRHVTGASLAKLEQDVEQALGAGEPLCVDPWAGAVFPRARHSRQAAQDPWRFWRPTSAVSDPDCSVPVLDDLLSVTSDVVTNNFDECKTKEIAASVGVAAEDATGIHEVTHFDTSRQDNAQDDRLSVPALVHDFVHMGSAMRDTFNSEVVSAVDEEINLCAIVTTSEHQLDDPWYALRGMALATTPVAGAVLFSSSTDEILPEGTSLLDCMLAHRTDCSRLARVARMTIEHASLPLFHGDVRVLRGDDEHDLLHVGQRVVACWRLATVVRLGFDAYANRVRVIFDHEDSSDWRAGLWVSLAECTPLLLPARFHTISDTKTACAERRLTAAGCGGLLRSFDADGDLCIRLDGRPRDDFIFKERATGFRFVA